MDSWEVEDMEDSAGYSTANQVRARQRADTLWLAHLFAEKARHLPVKVICTTLRIHREALALGLSIPIKFYLMYGRDMTGVATHMYGLYADNYHAFKEKHKEELDYLRQVIVLYKFGG